jgi:hypothetical protein
MGEGEGTQRWTVVRIVGSGGLGVLVRPCVTSATKGLSRCNLAYFHNTSQTSTIGTDGFLSPVRLPISPPGRFELT